MLGSKSDQKYSQDCFPFASQFTTMRLTNESAARLKLPIGKDDRIVFDDDLAGFGLRFRAGGKRTWIVQYRIGTKQRRLTLGSTTIIDATEARRRAKSALAKVHLGHDPQIQKAEARAQAAVTLGSVVGMYLTRARERLKLRSYFEVERHLKKHWGPLSEMSLAKIGRSDIAARLNVIAQQNGPFAGNRARAALSALFSWAMGEGLADANPVVGTNKAIDEVSRDRVLFEKSKANKPADETELRLIWQHAGEGEYGSIVRLLILTGQRREEVGGMRWPEVDLDGGTWTMPGTRTKNGLDHEVPLSDEAITIVRNLPRRTDRELVFGSREGSFSGWSKAKSALDKRIAGAGEMKPWRLHDIRRTVATRLVELGVLPHVVEAVLNHASGHKAGVAGIYNRATYSKEKRAALTLWAEHIKGLIGAGDKMSW
jgi:integrase